MAVKGNGSRTEVVLFAARPVCCKVKDLYLAARGLWLNRFKQPLDALHLAKLTLVESNV